MAICRNLFLLYAVLRSEHRSITTPFTHLLQDPPAHAAPCPFRTQTPNPRSALHVIFGPNHLTHRFTEAVIGPSSVLLLELVVAAAIAISLEVVALIHGGNDQAVSIWLYTMQSLNFVVLFALIMLMEQVSPSRQSRIK